MIESLILSFIKSLPSWLSQVVEVLLVAVIFSFCVIFLFGMWTGIKIIGRRANKISEITVFPPSIKFKQDE
jgi:TRAP-type C4-dicarboxylate transport system permease small subunit